MKTIYSLGLIMTLLSLVSFNNPVEIREITKPKAKAFYQRTNKTLINAHAALKKSKNFKNDYALAVRHQQWAKKMYIRRHYDKVVHHSKRARLLALKVIKDNSGQVPVEAYFTKQEYADMGSSVPSDRDLDDAIALDGQHKLKDEELITKTLDLTFPD